MPAPIALFAFNRPDHLRRTLIALAANTLADQSHLTIYCDAPRHEQDVPKTDAVKAVACSAHGFKSVTVVTREKNLGCAASVISGITETLEECDRLVVLEDDLVTSPFFLRYMNDALNLYADTPEVGAVHGWSFPHTMLSPPATFFLKTTGCWGWGTWSRAWAAYASDGQALYDALEKRKAFYDFDVDGSYPYSRMLQDQICGKNDSWAIRWYACNFLAGKLTLNSNSSLVQQIGMDSSGTHCTTGIFREGHLASEPVPVFPIPIEEDKNMLMYFKHFCRKSQKGLMHKFKARIKYFVKLLY